MNEDSLASTEIHAAIAQVLNDYYAATITDPPDLKQRIWQQVAPWLTFAREGSVGVPAHVTNETSPLSEPDISQNLPSPTLNATIFRGIAILFTLILIALFVSVVLTSLSH